MKKKLAVLSLVVALLAVAVGGSLAFFADTDLAENTFTIGEIDIVQHEQEHNDEDGLQDFTQNQTLLPIINTSDPASDENYIEKLVSVENTGKNDAYVRTFIAVPAAIKDILCLDTADAADGWIADTNAWENVTVDGIEYAVVSFTYDTKLAKDDVTDYVLKGVYLDAAVDIQKNASGVRQFCTCGQNGAYTFYDYDITKDISVLVATQGCQADGFENGAVDALDTVFENTAPAFE